MTNPLTRLSIREVELNIHLGLLENERVEAQAILFDIDLSFATPPKGCQSDSIEDVVCYAELLEHLRTHIPQKEYHLIEHLAHDIYLLVKQKVPPETRVAIQLYKHPKLEGLSGGVSFYFSDGTQS